MDQNIRNRVSYQSLDALAALAISTLANPDRRPEDDRTIKTIVSAYGALANYICKNGGLDDGDPYISDIGEGLDLGLKIAAAIMTHGLDADAVREDVRVALIDNVRPPMRTADTVSTN